MTADARRIESKLAKVLAAHDCGICAQRPGLCPGCGHPVGSLETETRYALSKLTAVLDGIEGRLRRGQSTVLSLVEDSS